MKTTLISSLLATSMIALPSGDNVSEISETSLVSTNKSVVELPLSIEYVEGLYKNITDPVQASLRYINEYKQIEEERQEFYERREEQLREKERKTEEAKLELARRESVTFNAYDVTQKSYVTEQELRKVLYNTNGGDGLAPYAAYFVEAEELYGLNAFFMTAIAAQESGWGKKAAGNGTNLTGYAVYTRNHTGTTFEGGIKENILATAKLIANEYVNPEGRYYTKWDNYTGRSVFEINQKYCLLQDQKTVDNRWSQALNKIGNDLNKTYHETVKERTI